MVNSGSAGRFHGPALIYNSIHADTYHDAYLVVEKKKTKKNVNGIRKRTYRRQTVDKPWKVRCLPWKVRCLQWKVRFLPWNWDPQKFKKNELICLLVFLFFFGTSWVAYFMEFSQPALSSWRRHIIHVIYIYIRTVVLRYDWESGKLCLHVYMYLYQYIRYKLRWRYHIDIDLYKTVLPHRWIGNHGRQVPEGCQGTQSKGACGGRGAGYR